MTIRPLTATYRVQFSTAFTFDDARRLVPYFRDLGISHLYASPIFQARAGSAHGYDVVDHDAVSPELGGEAGLRRLAEALHAAGLGLIVDIVPNHAGIGGGDNRRWRDVLEFGRRSRNARFFDIDWSAGPLVLPVLGAPLGEILAEGRAGIVVEPDEGRFFLAVEETRLPLRPKSVGDLAAAAAEAADDPALGAAAEAWAGLEDGRFTAGTRRE
ncbi:alpha-amylase family glycosyl hydrolase, partial [Oharaeibacter diazotrophicus]